MSETRRSSTTQRLAELRSAQPCDTTLQNLLSILNAKLDLSARLPVFEYEADSEGFPEAASFMSALASAERESVQDVLRSLRMHLDAHQRALHLVLEGLLMISVALIADSGPALEAMTRSLAVAPRRGHRPPLPRPRPHRRRPQALRPGPRPARRDALAAARAPAPRRDPRASCPQARVVVRAARPDAGWLADALRAGASAVVPATAGAGDARRWSCRRSSPTGATPHPTRVAA